MDDPRFFDAGCRVGLNKLGKGGTAEILLQEMEKFGVSGALVSDYPLDGFGAVLSNRRISDLLKQPGTEKLYGVWCLLPEQCGELPPPVEFFGSMRENRIAAVTLDPFNHRYVPGKLTIGKYMAEAEKRRVPVLLDAFSGKWNELYAFLETFPENLYIFSAYFGKWGPDRQIRPLLENYPGFHFGLGGYWQPDGIGELVDKYGAKQLLFSSGFPRYAAGAAMLQLKHAGLNEADFRAIAGGNLERILKGERL